MGSGGLQNRDIPICHLLKMSPLSFKAVVSTKENLYLSVNKLRCLNELKASQDERFFVPMTKNKEQLTGFQQSILTPLLHPPHPRSRSLTSLPALSSFGAELRPTQEGLAAPRHLCPRVLAGSVVLARQRPLAWPAGNTTPLPEESLGGQRPHERWRALGKCGFREVWSLPFLGGSDDSEKEAEGGIQRF